MVRNIKQLFNNMKTETRSQLQNRALFKFHELVANTMNQSWISLSKLILEIEPRPTKESLHMIFKEILFKMFQKNTTTKMTRSEMNDVLDVYLQALSVIWITIEFPSADRQNLLSFYN